MVWSAILGPVIAGIFGVIDKAVENKDQAAAIKVKLQEMVLTGQMREIEEAAANIRAEATGDSWLQRSWRPLTMLTFVSLIVAKWLGFTAPGVTEAVELALFEIIKIGLGGYVIGRSVEKGIKVWKER
jgi:Holin of 3TMs, for gene-transfer release